MDPNAGSTVVARTAKTFNSMVIVIGIPTVVQLKEVPNEIADKKTAERT